MKQKMFCLLLVLIGCSLFASPNRNSDNCDARIKGKVIRVLPLNKANTEVADDLELLPMHQLVNCLL